MIAVPEAAELVSDAIETLAFVAVHTRSGKRRTRVRRQRRGLRSVVQRAASDRPHCAESRQGRAALPVKAEPVSQLRRDRRRGRPRKPEGEPSEAGGASRPASGAPISLSSTSAPMVSAKAFWKQAELISPGRPWVAAARELGVNPAIVQDASRKPVAAQCQSSRNGALPCGRDEP